MFLNKYNIQYDKAINSWDEALPLGNGKLGGLIYGGGPVRLALDRVDLWDLRPNPTTLEKGFHYSNLVSLVKDGSKDAWKEYCRLFDEVFNATAYPCKITAGRLEFDFGICNDNIRSKLDIEKGVAFVQLAENKGKIEAFFSAIDFVGVAKVWGKYELNLHIPNYIYEKESASALGYPRAEVMRERDYIYYSQQTHTEFRYGIVILQKHFEEYDELYFTIATNKDNENFIDAAKKELEQIAKVGYNVQKERHITWWKKYWSKSEICIGDELLEKTYYRSWYLFASCSRKGFYPMPLQGVWTADHDKLPPWKGDYHHDTNTELSYQSYLKANRLEEGRVFIDYLWGLKERFEKFAEEFFGVKGLLIPSCSTLDGKAMGGWGQYSLSPTMTIWAAQSFDEYWKYTGDEVFIKERAYPFFKEVEEAISALLRESDGKLYLPLSSSPEIFDDSPRAYLIPNSNFDLALLRYLYKTLIDYSKILQKDGIEYEKKLSKLDDIAIWNHKVVMLDRTQKLEESHRHFSHLMCMYPLHLINYDTEANKKIYEGTIYEIERLGMGMWVGFSYAMCAQIYAMALKGNSAYEKLRQFANGFVADNGFHLNGDFKNYGYSTFHYRPFTLESSFGFCDALHEMLLQDHQGYLHLFPAIPETWKTRTVAFRNLRSIGGILVSAVCENGELKELQIESKCDAEIKLKDEAHQRLKIWIRNKSYYITKTEGYFLLTLKSGKIKCVPLQDE